MVAPGLVSCADCGWPVTKEYNALTNKFVYPSLRVESSFSNKYNNINKMKNNPSENGFTQGVVATATGFPGGLWGVSMALNKKPLGGNESSFDPNFATDVSQQSIVGFGIGQEWVPALAGSEQVSESGYTFGEKLKSAFVRFTPAGVLVRDSFCGKYCKALGYMRSADKNGFKRCKAACKVNYINARNGKWTYPAAPEGAEEAISPEDLAAMSEKEVNSMPPNVVESAARNVAADEGSVPAPAPKSNMMMWIVIGVVVLAIIIAIIIMMRKKQQAA